MGEVWSATHTVTQRRYALKFLHRRGVHSAELKRRFLREARAASAIGHESVVGVQDIFELESGTPLMVMELLEGETLGARLQRDGSLSVEASAGLLLPVVSAVGTAHEQGVIHRDLKPDNIFLTTEGAVKVLDFGIAKLSKAESAVESVPTQPTQGLLGTPFYMAPEQAVSEADVDHRADIWALGVILYEALSGGRPIEGENVEQMVRRLLEDGIVPIAVLVPDLPADIVALLGRMLQRDPEERPQDLREVATGLKKYTDVAASYFGPPNSSTVSEVSEADVQLGSVQSIREPAPPSRRLPLVLAGIGLIGVVLLIWRAVSAPGAAIPAERSNLEPVSSSSALNVPTEPDAARSATAELPDVSPTNAVAPAASARRRATAPVMPESTQPLVSATAASASTAPNVPSSSAASAPPVKTSTTGLVQEPPF